MKWLLVFFKFGSAFHANYDVIQQPSGEVERSPIKVSVQIVKCIRNNECP